LARDLLECHSARIAADLAAKEIGRHIYAGCNVVCADHDSAYVLHAGDWLRVRPLPPGLHVLTANDVNDASDRRLGHALWWLSERPLTTAAEAVAALQELCRQAGPNDPPICLHGPKGGTVSSSIAALRAPLARSIYLHAQGPPDTTPYRDYSSLMADLGSTKRNGA
jgi:hypothetical protein